MHSKKQMSCSHENEETYNAERVDFEWNVDDFHSTDCRGQKLPHPKFENGGRGVISTI